MFDTNVEEVHIQFQISPDYSLGDAVSYLFTSLLVRAAPITLTPLLKKADFAIARSTRQSSASTVKNSSAIDLYGRLSSGVCFMTGKLNGRLSSCNSVINEAGPLSLKFYQKIRTLMPQYFLDVQQVASLRNVAHISDSPIAFCIATVDKGK
ncbi:hypothetical protein [Pseudoalteromonas piscicida]|uniref:Uncharacterized protein n=1 Tax=Pseudoalteromonas piscicida TaxID=43662 RepID=A0AAD0RFS5_PSEO7|nr:hypothetical protein [Pseudoalteromonas piscicida]ASD67486.1 hypothetical protein B1L02_10975 [Pseudoalteromonas piscicida]AXR01812.1 hypothetical protein D0511_06775 [Pseudoalteromonas piscicida]